MNLSSFNWKMTLLILWAVFSFLYISWNTYGAFKVNVMQNAYIAGQNDTIAKLLEQADNKECKPFNVYAGDKKADLINVACLQQAGQPAPEAAPQK